MSHLTQQLRDMQKEVDGLMDRLDIAEKVRQADEMEQQAGEPGFWDNPEAAQKIMQEMSRLRAQVEPWQRLAQRIADAIELDKLADEDFLPDLEQEVKALAAMVEKMSFTAKLSGPYDDQNAILAIHAGAGGTDSQDWAEMLERMYLRWAEENNYKVDVIE